MYNIMTLLDFFSIRVMAAEDYSTAGVAFSLVDAIASYQPRGDIHILVRRRRDLS
jgi:hypothetical protein